MNYLLALVIIVLAGLAIGIRIYNGSKDRDGEKFNLDGFLEQYGVNIQNAIGDAIKVLSVDMANYDSKEEYEKDIIDITVKAIYNNPELYGLNSTLLSMVSIDRATAIVQSVFTNNKVRTFAVLPTRDIRENVGIMDDKVILARGLTVDN